jgi:hypothetical protein
LYLKLPKQPSSFAGVQQYSFDVELANLQQFLPTRSTHLIQDETQA